MSLCALLLASAGCNGDDDDDDSATDDDDSALGDDDTLGDDDSAAPLDADEDGALFGEDCNDDDPALNLDDADGDGATTCDGDCDDGDPALNLDDADSDGCTTCEGDCDDDDPDNSAFFAEKCDGEDNDCDGEPEESGDGACGHIWTLQGGTTSWTRRDLREPGDTHAPEFTVEAAFAVTEVGKIWVLTNYTYHELSIDTLQWVASGDREEFVLNLGPEHSVFAASSLPSWWTGEVGATVVLYVTGNRHTYEYDLATDQLTLLTSYGYDDAWDSTLAPAHTHIRCAWHGVDNSHGWVVGGSPFDLCGDPSTQLGAYLSIMSLDGVVHLLDEEFCGEFFDDPSGSDFSIFTYDDAPAPTEVSAAAYTDDALHFLYFNDLASEW